MAAAVGVAQNGAEGDTIAQAAGLAGGGFVHQTGGGGVAEAVELATLGVEEFELGA